MTSVAIIGAGRGGTSLIEIFYNDPLVRIVGVADVDKNAPGIRLAKKLKIPVTQDYRKLLRSKKADLVIDVTGNKSVEKTLHTEVHPGMAIIGGPSAKFMWQLIEERIKSKEKIEQHLLEYQSLYRLYVKEVELAIAEERTRIACDIHDGLVQTLVGLNYRLDFCADQIEKNPARSLKVVDETKKLLKEAISEAREVIFNLRPIYLDRSGLFPSLENYLKTYEKQYQIKTALKTSGNEQSLSSQAKIFVFRIVQEALANVQKHARAGRVEVKVEIGRMSLHAAIVDDGIGFDWRKIKGHPQKRSSFGLKAIAERARLLGGEAEILSRPREGTRVMIKIPLQEGGSLE
ncbi:MAG TPA: sensor histidine kinase [Candidatus Manganitrophaceae bacterium]|nr:sensor histidine kinase [Candidatus Manganitrophaceae bacterium]